MIRFTGEWFADKIIKNKKSDKQLINNLIDKIENIEEAKSLAKYLLSTGIVEINGRAVTQIYLNSVENSPEEEE